MAIKIDRYPQLRFLCWFRDTSGTISEPEALSLYERQWRHVDTSKLDDDERALIDRLVRDHGNGVFLG